MSEAIMASKINYADSITRNEFNYKPIPVTTILAFVCGLGAILALFFPIGTLLAVLGMIFGLQSSIKTHRYSNEYGGKLLADTGLVLSSLMFFGGVGLHSYYYVTEVPEGFERISFTTDIAKKEFVNVGGKLAIHEDVARLHDKEIFLKGYMYPTRQTKDLTTFILCKDNGQCCFGGKPKMTDMILVQMKNDQVDYRPQMVSVAGRFQLNPNATGEELSPVYALEAVHFSPAKTSF